jgi:hypothetical protein
MKLFFITVLTLMSIHSVACMCPSQPLINSFNGSSFVARVKVLKVIPNASDKDYHDLDIEVVNLYKGKVVNNILAHTFQRSSCRFEVPVNSIWLVFANFNQSGIPTFSYCSSSYQMDRAYDVTEDTEITKGRNRRDAMMMETLEFLKTKQNEEINASGLTLIPKESCILSIDGYKEQKNNVAIFELTINQALSIKKIEVIQNFSNRKLARAVYTCISNSIAIPGSKGHKSDLQKMLIFYYLGPDNYNTKSTATNTLN